MYMSAEYTRLIIRQGLEPERQDVVFRSGEPAYTTDYKRLFIGDNNTPGGLPVGMKFLGFCTFDDSSNNVENVNPGYTGDILFENNTNLLYILSGDDYKNKNNYYPINKTPVPDNQVIYNNNGRLSILPRSLNFNFFAGFSIGRGLEKFNDLTLRLKQPGRGLDFDSGGNLIVKVGGVDNGLLSSMDKDTVKARLGQSGSPGDITLRELANAISSFIAESTSIGAVGVPVGTILDFGGAVEQIPGGYLVCDGREYSKTEYPVLAQVLRDTWGVSSDTTFTVPNLMQRTTVGAGQNYFTGTSGINTTVGSYGGTFSVELQRSQIPRHNHEFRIDLPLDTEVPAISGSQTKPVWGFTDGGPDIGKFGSIFGQAHSNLQPSAVVLKIIRAK